MIKIELQGENYYTFSDTYTSKLIIKGELTGTFEVIKDFEKWGWRLSLIQDDEGVYLIINKK